MSIRDLARLVEPPSKPLDVPKRLAWSKVEKMLGTRLPSDYKEFVAAYGSGLLGRLIVVLNPFSKTEGIEFFSGAGLMTNGLRALKAALGDTEVPYDVFPDPGGLLPWGGDQNGNGLYWLTGGEPDKWPCVVGEGRGDLWQQFDMPMTKFLASVFSRDVRCKIWPRGFPTKHDSVFDRDAA